MICLIHLGGSGGNFIASLLLNKTPKPKWKAYNNEFVSFDNEIKVVHNIEKVIDQKYEKYYYIKPTEEEAIYFRILRYIKHGLAYLVNPTEIVWADMDMYNLLKNNPEKAIHDIKQANKKWLNQQSMFEEKLLNKNTEIISMKYMVATNDKVKAYHKNNIMLIKTFDDTYNTNYSQYIPY